MLVLHVRDAERKARCTQLTRGPRGIWITPFDAAVWILVQVYVRREGMCVISHTAWSSRNVMRVRTGGNLMSMQGSVVREFGCAE